MAIYSPRTRLVNFRLSEDEYQTLKDAAIRQGARSISDFARGRDSHICDRFPRGGWGPNGPYRPGTQGFRDSAHGGADFWSTGQPAKPGVYSGRLNSGLIGEPPLSLQ